MGPPHLQADGTTRGGGFGNLRPFRRARWHRARIEEWLGKRRPLRLRTIHVLLTRDSGLKASYGTLRRYAIEELG
jgi:hypothetical protein